MKIIRKNILSIQTNETDRGRIPGIIYTRKGTTIAYFEDRKGPGNDWADISIAISRSFDDGSNWEPVRIIVESKGETLNNPIMISSLENDIIHFLYCRNYDTCFHCISNDEGLTWSEPENITYVFEKFRKDLDWKCIAIGPGHGITMKNRRIVIPVWMSLNRDHTNSVSGCVYSDDNGKTWETGGIVYPQKNMPSPNETIAEEFKENTLVFTHRSCCSEKYRWFSISKDGGITFELFSNKSIKDPWCMCGLKLAGDGKLLLSHCDHESNRINLNLKSTVNLKDWTDEINLEYYGGYSDLAVNPNNGTIICFYETAEEKNEQWINLVAAVIET